MRTAALVIAVIGCAGVALAVLAIVRWGATPFVAAPDDVAGATGGPDATSADHQPGRRPLTTDLRWWLRLVAVHVLGGVASGVLVAGLGGRLAMRIIAATSDADAQGRITEADEVVGAITVDGTIGFLLFVGLGAGLLSALVYLVLRPVLPQGRLGGLALGLLILVVAATRLDPLRADNRDFDIVGPDLLSIAIFGVLPLLLGMTVAAITNRLSQSVPSLTSSPRTWLPHLALVPVLVVGPIGALFVLAGAFAIAVRRSGVTVPRDRVLLVGRVALAAVALVALPGFVMSIADIATG